MKRTTMNRAATTLAAVAGATIITAAGTPGLEAGQGRGGAGARPAAAVAPTTSSPQAPGSGQPQALAVSIDDVLPQISSGITPEQALRTTVAIKVSAQQPNRNTAVIYGSQQAAQFAAGSLPNVTIYYVDPASFNGVGANTIDAFPNGKGPAKTFPFSDTSKIAGYFAFGGGVAAPPPTTSASTAAPVAPTAAAPTSATPTRAFAADPVTKLYLPKDQIDARQKQLEAQDTKNNQPAAPEKRGKFGGFTLPALSQVVDQAVGNQHRLSAAEEVAEKVVGDAGVNAARARKHAFIVLGGRNELETMQKALAERDPATYVLFQIDPNDKQPGSDNGALADGLLAVGKGKLTPFWIIPVGSDRPTKVPGAGLKQAILGLTAASGDTSAFTRAKQ